MNSGRMMDGKMIARRLLGKWVVADRRSRRFGLPEKYTTDSDARRNALSAEAHPRVLTRIPHCLRRLPEGHCD